MLDKIVLIDDKVGSSDPPPKEIDFFELDGQACLEDMDLAVSTLKEQTTSANELVLCALMISCNGRGPVSPFMDDETMADARRFNNLFPEVPCLGFYAGGEIGPLARARRNGHNVYRQGSVAFQGVSNFNFFFGPMRA
jgi:small ligand-binding sensory domain FIST